MVRTDRFWVRGETIGRGTLGDVFTAMSQEDGRIIAVKEIQLTGDSRVRDSDKLLEDIEREIQTYQDCKHENVVSYLGHGRFDGSLYIYLEYMPGGSLAQVLQQYGRLEESLLRVYMRQILHGLHYLHTRSPAIIHRDIKGANILVGLDCKVKLADFGCCARCKLQPTDQSVSLDGSKVSATMTGSIPWMAPEVMNQQVYGRKADIWSLGCLLLEMATGKQPWGLNFDNPMAAMCKIAMSNETPPIPDFVTAECRDFLQRCLQRDPKARPHCSELLEHPFVRESD
jgi:serine/threonine protein kinase